jgi:hypothetical protein
MPKPRKKERHATVLEEGQTFAPGDEITAVFEGDRTQLDLGAVAESYKLRDAYADIRNLEFRADKEVALQKFTDYRRERAPVDRRRYAITTKTRPKFREIFLPKGPILLSGSNPTPGTSARLCASTPLRRGLARYHASPAMSART